MFRLHPLPDVAHVCPHCRVPLQVTGWYMPGMRSLADLRCTGCAGEFYGDLAAGQGLYTPMLLDKKSGRVHDQHGMDWFADWLGESYGRRTATPRGLKIEELRPLRGKPVVLNCLDTLYGHCLLKLLNAQHYLDRRPDVDLIVIVPRLLRWMVPDGVAQIWAVDLPLSQGLEWNDWLAAEIADRIGKWPECWLSVAFSHPRPGDWDIERFTRIQPFPRDEWDQRLDRPTITFIWRDDRLWHAPSQVRHGKLKRVLRKCARYFQADTSPLQHQMRHVRDLSLKLREQWKELDFAVAGLGQFGGMPEWITDLRRSRIDVSTEREWCDRYARSHIVIGVHGSNMLLPSAHAGAAVELVPLDRWPNIIQATLYSEIDPRVVAYRYRYIPVSASADDAAAAISALLQGHDAMMITLRTAACDHSAIKAAPERWYFDLSKRKSAAKFCASISHDQRMANP